MTVAWYLTARSRRTKTVNGWRCRHSAARPVVLGKIRLGGAVGGVVGLVEVIYEIRNPCAQSGNV